VVYQPDYCLDFTDSEFIDVLSSYYDSMKHDFQIAGIALPKNKDISQDQYKDLILRELDCAVIEYLHQSIEAEIETDNLSRLQPFDAVRGIFTEGRPAYEGAGIQRKNHIQVCIRNLNCIKG